MRASSDTTNWFGAAALIALGAIGALILWPRAAGAGPIVRQPSPLPPLAQGNHESDRRVVLVLQQQLRALGFTVPVNGMIGTETRTAMNAFAVSAGIPVDAPDAPKILAIDIAYGDAFDAPMPVY